MRPSGLWRRGGVVRGAYRAVGTRAADGARRVVRRGEILCDSVGARSVLFANARGHAPRRDDGRRSDLIREFGVAVIPGSTFGIEDGCTLRVAFGALDADTTSEGIGRLVRRVTAIAGGG